MLVQHLGLVPYAPTWQAMRAYTHGRTANHADALWLCQHPPVFTQGLAARAEHVLSPGRQPLRKHRRMLAQPQGVGVVGGAAMGVGTHRLPGRGVGDQPQVLHQHRQLTKPPVPGGGC